LLLFQCFCLCLLLCFYTCYISVTVSFKYLHIAYYSLLCIYFINSTVGSTCYFVVCSVVYSRNSDILFICPQYSFPVGTRLLSCKWVIVSIYSLLTQYVIITCRLFLLYILAYILCVISLPCIVMRLHVGRACSLLLCIRCLPGGGVCTGVFASEKRVGTEVI
jgi:hypothetical protein